MRLVAAALILQAAAPSPPAAPLPRWNPKAPENTQLLPDFTIATVAPVLNAIGARYQRSGTDPAKPAFLATFPNKRRALISFASCDPQGKTCKALSLQAFWTKNPAIAPERTAQAIERFNQRYAFAKAFVTPDGRPSLQRYLTADYGFIRGDLAVNLLVFADQTERFAVEFLEPLTRAGKN